MTSPLSAAVRPSGRSWLLFLKYLVASAFVTTTLAYLLVYTSSFVQLRDAHLPSLSSSSKAQIEIENKHPIDNLIINARAEFAKVLGRQSYDVTSASRLYRQRRGRHPPPGFDKWFAYAQKRDAVIVEDFFDRIYSDLTPFWAIKPSTLRHQAKSYEFVVSVRKGLATFTTDDKKRVPWIQLWHGLVKEIAKDLPDVDMPVNMMDESRLLVPWEDINEYMKIATASRNLRPASEVITNFTGLVAFDAAWETSDEPYDPQFKGGHYWDLARQACPPGSPSRNETSPSDWAEHPFFPAGYPENSHHGFVQNWTYVKDPCEQPHLRGLHGTFIEPVSVSTSQKFIPLFGGSKLATNNDILIPPATYLNSDPLYSGGNSQGPNWDDKKDGLMWRGVASGGRNKAENWQHFQRHRFVQMVNATAVIKAETTRIKAETFDLPDWKHYNLMAPRNGYLGEWLNGTTDAAFVDLLCFPAERDNRGCSYSTPYFEWKEAIPMAEQYKYKYLPDIDGNSFSGRYRGFLRSTSLPIKATIYQEWHDDRLFPWLHFVPMDNTFVDIYGILEYFMGYEGQGGHDENARRIAEEGQEWAEKVLRREDMAIYTYRLLLEWARICDDNREKMGWVGDLKKGFIGAKTGP
ncbi:hypothetical protein EJ08DRAFT_57944 [Tothia fuscella]|uniref:Glycosyl transferase CAP10 domain-containing protein n=1 Tax=Tothia fuscella TaxID=1048955 RepID=A0A9P4NYQ4_9PEZI|nr:hypothetical protein EJ08DRAFT_57944 [Tothia fuscella]